MRGADDSGYIHTYRPTINEGLFYLSLLPFFLYLSDCLSIIVGPRPRGGLVESLRDPAGGAGAELVHPRRQWR